MLKRSLQLANLIRMHKDLIAFGLPLKTPLMHGLRREIGVGGYAMVFSWQDWRQNVVIAKATVPLPVM
jgi:hypothetical protein